MWIRWLGTFALCTLPMGCQLASNAVHNVSYEAKLTAAEVLDRCKYEKLARASWECVQREDRRTFSADYADGFKDGFVDYLQFGGSGQPPYVPPKQYWGRRFRTPEGHQAVEEWFAGFRHGVAAAQQAGYREWVTVPTAQSTETPPGLPSGAVPGTEFAVPFESQRPKAPQFLPPPPQMPPGKPNTATAPVPQTSSRDRAPLGAPMTPAEMRARYQLGEPANGAVDPEAAPSMTQRPIWVIEVVNSDPDDVPPVAPAPPDLAAAKDTEPLPRPASVPGEESEQILVFPAVRPGFGLPRVVGGWISKD
jgi:hypothetical protein